MFTRKPCDDAFDREERSFKKAADRLLGAAITCVRQAGNDLARACRLFRDRDISQLGALLVENLRGEGNFDNVRAACHLFASGRRGSLRDPDNSPEELVVVAALSLEDAAQSLIDSAQRTEDLGKLLAVHPATVSSRAASGKVLSVLRHLA